jgi:hypothetical protein
MAIIVIYNMVSKGFLIITPWCCFELGLIFSIKEKFKINFLPSVHGGVVKLPMYLLNNKKIKR